MNDGQRDHFARCGQMATQALGLDDDHNSPDEVRVAIEQLMAIVAKLPTTADGVPVVPGMKVYQRETTNAGSTWNVVEHRAEEFWLYPGWIQRRTYNTRQAAEAAEALAAKQRKESEGTLPTPNGATMTRALKDLETGNWQPIQEVIDESRKQ